MHWTELAPFSRFIFILGVIAFVMLIGATAGGVAWLVTRKVPKPKVRPVNTPRFTRYNKHGKPY